MIGALAAAFLTTASVAAIDIGTNFLCRAGILPNTVRFRTVAFLLLWLAGAVAVSAELFLFGYRQPHAEAVQADAAAWFLFITLAIGYTQCKSLFSRGYSIRILFDLAEKGGRARIETLKESYGGMGLGGMLVKRMRFMTGLDLIEFDGSTVGPLTWKGKVLATLSFRFRQLLRLDMVG